MMANFTDPRARKDHGDHREELIVTQTMDFYSCPAEAYGRWKDSNDLFLSHEQSHEKFRFDGLKRYQTRSLPTLDYLQLSF